MAHSPRRRLGAGGRRRPTCASFALPASVPLGGRRNARAQASGATAPLYHLREERSQGDYNRGGMCETVDRFVREVEDGLKSMLGPGLFLEMEKITREGLP